MATAAASAEWSWDAATSLLASADTNSRCDGAAALFDEWYRVAVLHAKGELPGGGAAVLTCTTQLLQHLLRDSDPTFYRSHSSDNDVCAALLGNVRKLCRIFATKPKFTTLCMDASGFKFVGWTNSFAVARIEDALFASHIPDDRRMELLSTLHAFADLGNALCRAPDAPYTSNPFPLSLAGIAGIAAPASGDILIREAALGCLKAMGSTATKGPDVAMQLVKAAGDDVALEPIWNMGAMASPPCVDTLVQRITASRSSGDAFTRAVLTSLYEAVINLKSTEPDTAGAACDAPPSVLHPSSQPGLCRVLAACDDTGDAGDHTVRFSDGHERSGVFIQALQTLLEESESKEALLRLALTHPTHATVSMLSAISSEFDELTWLAVLLPFINDKVATMKESVSGKQEEQEVINLLREASRLFYLNTDRTPSPRFGHAVFLAILRAISHGYSETERFPELATRLLAFHLRDGSSAWLPAALDDTLCRARNVMRSVQEMVLVLLGIQTSAYGVEDALATARPSAEATAALLSVLASTRTIAADKIWVELCINNGSFVMQQDAAVCTLLQHMTEDVDSIIYARVAAGTSAAADDPYTSATARKLFSAAEVLRALSLRITPSNAPQLFNLTLKVMALLPGDRRGTLYSDASLACVASKVTVAESLPAAVVTEAKAVTGPLTRAALALLMPFPFLLDRHVDVRAAALMGVANAVRLHYDIDVAVKVLAATVPQSADADSLLVSSGLSAARFRTPIMSELPRAMPGVALTVPVVEAAVHDASLARAASAALAAVTVGVASGDHATAVVDAVMSSAISRLLHAARATFDLEVQGAPAQEVSTALDVVAAVDDTVLQRFAMSATGLRSMQELAKYSVAWANLLANLVAAHRLRAVRVAASARHHATPTAPAFSAAVSPGGRAWEYELVPVLDGQPVPDDDTAPFLGTLVTDAAAAAPSAPAMDAAYSPPSRTAAGLSPSPVRSSPSQAAFAADDGRRLLRRMNEAATAGHLMRALALSAQLRHSHPAVFAAEGVGDRVRTDLLPRIANELMPQPAVLTDSRIVFAAEDLDRWAHYVSLSREVQVYAGADAEAVVKLSARITDLTNAVVLRELAAKGPAAARAWMLERGIHNPSLSAAIDRAEVAGSTAALTSPPAPEAVAPAPAVRSAALAAGAAAVVPAPSAVPAAGAGVSAGASAAAAPPTAATHVDVAVGDLLSAPYLSVPSTTPAPSREVTAADREKAWEDLAALRQLEDATAGGKAAEGKDAGGAEADAAPTATEAKEVEVEVAVAAAVDGAAEAHRHSEPPGVAAEGKVDDLHDLLPSVPTDTPVAVPPAAHTPAAADRRAEPVLL